MGIRVTIYSMERVAFGPAFPNSPNTQTENHQAPKQNSKPKPPATATTTATTTAKKTQPPLKLKC